jgi:hypothetical protein
MAARKLPSILYGKPQAIASNEERRERRIELADAHRRQCNRFRKGTSLEKEMSKQAQNCTLHNPCGEGWCQQCMCRAQEKVFDDCGPALQRFLKDVQREAKRNGRPIPKAWVFSGVDVGMAVKRGHLDASAIRSRNSELRSRLNSSVLSEAICFIGWDISLNFKVVELEPGVTKKKKYRWQPHVYGVVFAETKAQVRRVLTPVFGLPTIKWGKPVTVLSRASGDIPSTIRYALKPNFDQRNVTRGRKRYGERFDGRITEEHKDELAVFLGELGFKDRLFLKGVKLVRGTLVRTNGRSHLNMSDKREELRKRLRNLSPGTFDTFSKL